MHRLLRSSPNTSSCGATFRSQVKTSIALRATQLLLHKASLPSQEIERAAEWMMRTDLSCARLISIED
jgi:hypothetical protein